MEKKETSAALPGSGLHLGAGLKAARAELALPAEFAGLENALWHFSERGCAGGLL